MNPIGAIAIEVSGVRVGVIRRIHGERNVFDIDSDYLGAHNPPTLSLSLKSESGEQSAARPVRQGLPPFFSNLLPEGHLRDYLAALIGVKPVREFFLLAALGGDLPGAVTATAIEGEDGLPIDSSELSGTPESRGPLRFSLAGVQLKFSALAEASGGLTIPANGAGGSWIVKLPSLRFYGVSENEFAMLSLARAMGIAVPKIRLVTLKDIAGLPTDLGRLEGMALAVERFDRAPNGKRIHMEDFAQIFGVFPQGKYKYRSYANIAAVLSAEAGEDAVFEFVKRLVFSVMIGNADMHLKNWSVLYPDGRKAVLAPAYDYVSTVPYLPSDQLALNFGAEKSLDQISLEQVRRFVDKARLPMAPVWRIVRETMNRTAEAWASLPEKDVLTADLRTAIDAQIRRVQVAP